MSWHGLLVSIIVVKSLLGDFPSGGLTGISGARSASEHISKECEASRVESEHSLAVGIMRF